MNIKEKVKSYSFWVSLSSALILIIKVIGNKFGFTIDATLASDLITSLCSILVVTGIIVTPTPKSTKPVQDDIETKITESSLEEDVKTNEVETINTSQDAICETENNKIVEIEEAVQTKTVESDSQVCDMSQTNNISLNLENGFLSQKSKIDDDVKLYIQLLENEINRLENSMKD